VTRQDIFTTCRSGVAQVVLESGREQLTAGTSFLVRGGLVTNSHVIRDVEFDVAVIRFEDMDRAAGIRLSREACEAAVAYESPRAENDVVLLQLEEPEFAGRHVFAFGDSGDLRVGDEVDFMGFPFRLPQLTCHVGYVSSLHRDGGVDVIQVDGSVNGGNSGGPLIELSGDKVVGIISRAEVGFLADQFDELIRTLTRNIEQLERSTGARVVLAGVDPVQGLRASQAALREIAVSVRRSANVGIGYAFSSNHIRDRIAELQQGQAKRAG
jgi:S1-C subfamily serine protease